MPRTTRKSQSGSAIGTLIVLAVVIVLGIYFARTGSDPLGLFGDGATATRVTVPTFTPAPAIVITSVAPPATNTPAPQANVAPPATKTPAPASWYEVGFVSPIRVRAAEEEEYGSKGIPANLLKGSLTEKLIKYIDAAQISIHIASFETDIVDIANALIRAHERGVEVQWITDDEFGLESDEEPGHGQFALMQERGIEIIDDQRGGLMHNKFWLFDNEVVWTGSTNITISGMFEQDNNLIIIKSSELAAIYEQQFAEMWAGEMGARSPSDVEAQRVTVQDTQIQVLFSPEDDAIKSILPYIQNAQSSIRFLAFSYTQPDLGAAMRERIKNGITVEGVYETVGSDTQYSQMLPLQCAGGQMRQDTNFAFMHHKVIIIDKRYVITGSLNFSDSANSKNNENVIIIDNPAIAKQYLAEFERIWNISQTLDPEKFKCKP
jgi:phosphatidylserine/phosphatidylglycerophosphate/cardiolipin synthase-like enzyme